MGYKTWVLHVVNMTFVSIIGQTHVDQILTSDRLHGSPQGLPTHPDEMSLRL
jgi:hypothetical protein